MRQWFSLIVLLSTCVAVVSCGSNAEIGFSFDEEEPDAGTDASVDSGFPTDPGTTGDSGGGCTKLSCADQGIECGPAGDGCGGLIECGGCEAPETCGGGGEYSKCGGSAGCVPRTCDDVEPDSCGPVADGCGGLIECGSCTAPDICGGGGVASRCGHTKGCTPKTCADVESEGLCGPQSDGCGGILDSCASLSCEFPELCGGDPTKPGQCGVPPIPADGGVDDGCTPRTCDDYGPSTCGPQSDGCGGLIHCAASCGAGETCGGDPTKPGQCGEPPKTCTPKTCAELGVECGKVGDGCGGSIDCEGCPAGQQCGKTGQPGVCVPASACEPLTCADYPAGTCGQQSDGCGNLIDCSGCTGAGEECGGDPTKPGRCAVPPPSCTPRTCQQLGIGCGKAGDGCGGELSCGSCGSGEVCGGSGKPSQCVPIQGECTPRTCESLGFECGFVGDGCGGTLNCWPDPANPKCPEAHQACVGIPAVCKEGTGGGCTGPLCDDIPTDCGSNPTRITGRVTTPNGSLNVPNAIVYIPRDPGATLPAIGTGPSCDLCDDEDHGPLLAGAITDHRGEFTLSGDIPTGVPFNIVVKAGKWRSVRQVPSVTKCVSNNLENTYTRLPANKTDGLAGTHLPHIAIATGDADAMECVFYKMGIAESEFTNRSGNGRIHLYRDNGAKYASARTPRAKPCGGGGPITGCGDSKCQASESACRGCDGWVFTCDWTPYDYTEASVSASELPERFNDYDVVVWDCGGNTRTVPTSAQKTLMRGFVDVGGRFFSTDFGAEWIQNNGDMHGAANWTSRGTASSDRGYLSFERPQANSSRLRTFARWLQNEGAATMVGDPPTFAFIDPVQDPRDYVSSVNPGAEEWVFRTGGTKRDTRPSDWPPSSSKTQTLSFNTPFGETGSNICGRVTYSGFHVAEGLGSGGAGSKYFPEHCSGDLTSQEKVLAYMLFDLAACVSEGDPPQPPACTPLTKAEACAGGKCGIVSNGCGGVVECDGCPAGEYCSPSNTCVSPTCEKLDCVTDLNAECGVHADGCGGTMNCGTCTGPETCGGGGIPNQCGVSSCVPRTCADFPDMCGVQSDGCGGLTANCGSCELPATCGGAGVPNQCGGVACTPLSCGDQGIECGPAGDGCGGIHESCGSCTFPDTCGGGGIPGKCGHPGCSPRSCEAQGIECGPAGDGCGGGHESCGSCTWPETCGGGGIPGKCGMSDGGFCEPRSCDDLGLECGPAGDGCGGLLDCGKCEAPDTCGGAGVPGQCGHIACEPTTCESLGIGCGPTGDGCGGMLDCGECDAPETCGGGGKPGQCGKPDCTPRTCAEAGISCGPMGDGCGGVVECGSCQPPQSCGGGGQPGVCGGGIR